jgi:signal transduction histidine kinase
MSADALLQVLTQALFVAVFAFVGVAAIRRPRRANFDIALLFGAIALAIADVWITSALDITPNRVLTALSGSLVMAMPYLLLRLLDDFSAVPRAVMWAAEAGLALSVIGLFLVSPPLPAWLTLAYVLYFFVLEVYAAVAFVREARSSNGVTRRRMQAVAAGSIFLGLAILMAGFQIGLPALAGLWTALSQGAALASGVGYFLGFAPPRWLRRAWQEPELRAFLAKAASLPRLPDTDAIVEQMIRGTAATVGAPGAAIGLWDPDAGVLLCRYTPSPSAERFLGEGEPAGGTAGFAQRGDVFELQSGHMIAGQAFARQRPIFSTNAERDDPANAEAYRAFGSTAVLAAPITAGTKPLGVLVVYAPRAPIFGDDDLVLVQLLADQAAVILESRALIDEAARVKAREEAARLKDDFLSAAAHDLKTPLTTLVAQAQLLELRAARNPAAPADPDGIGRILRESKRLRSLVLELLDASRVEQGRLLGAREPVDLVQQAREVCERQSSDRHPCQVEADGPVIGEYDPIRITQLLENLVENGIKYSPQGGEVCVKVWRDDEEAHLSVTDRGIGIPEKDLPRVFERFFRGDNVDDRSFAGMGLGLFICRGIAEQHGGRISVNSRPGRGSAFHVDLPISSGVLVS